MLEAVDFGRIGDEKQRPELALRNGVVSGLLFAEIEELAELADFFVEGHLFEERVGTFADSSVIGRSAGGRLGESEWCG
jgi:hypothetical protein